MSIQFKHLNYLKIILSIAVIIILIFSLFSFFEQGRDENPEINKIRELYTYFEDNEEKGKDLQALYDSIWQNDVQVRDNSHFQFALDNAFQFYSLYEQDSHNIAYLNKTIHHPNFKHQHYLNQFYSHYFLASKYAENLKLDSAIHYTMKSDSLVMKNPILHEYEMEQLKNLMLSNYNEALQLDNLEVERFTKQFERLNRQKKRDNAMKRLKVAYVIALIHSKINNNNECIHWINIGAELAQELDNKFYQIELNNLKVKAFYSLNQKNKIRELYEAYKKQYKNSEIDEKMYMNGMKGVLPYMTEFLPKDEILEHTDKQIDYYGSEGCKHRYHLTTIYSFRSQVYKELKDTKNEIENLKKALYYSNSCGNTDEFFIQQESNNLTQLIELGMSEDLHEELKIWVPRKKIVDSIINSNKVGYPEFSLQLMRLNTEHFAHQTKDLESIEDLQEKHKKTYYYILMILLPAVIISFWILKKNNAIKNSIAQNFKKLKSNQKQIKNKKKALQALVKILEKSNLQLEQFAYNAACDISSPIQYIDKNLLLISEKYQDLIGKEDEEIMHYLFNATKSLNIMIDELLMYSKKEKNIDKNQKVNLHSILEEVKLVLKKAIVEKQGLVRFHGSKAYIISNTSLLKQVFQNLIANALKFHRENEVPKIDVYISELPNDRVQLEFVDQGIGIPQDQLDEIFQMFKKLNSSEEFEGHGIGLSTCKKIINELGGKIWAKSEVGKGSHFFIQLPRFVTKETSYIADEKVTVL